MDPVLYELGNSSDIRFNPWILYKLPEHLESYQEQLEDRIRHSFKITQSCIDRPFGEERYVRFLMIDPADPVQKNNAYDWLRTSLYEGFVPQKLADSSSYVASELIENALKHAYHFEKENFVTLLLVSNSDRHRLEIGFKDPKFDAERISEIYKSLEYFRHKNSALRGVPRANMGLLSMNLHFNEITPVVHGPFVDYYLRKEHKTDAALVNHAKPI